jgi:hypothetical protein
MIGLQASTASTVGAALWLADVASGVRQNREALTHRRGGSFRPSTLEFEELSRRPPGYFAVVRVTTRNGLVGTSHLRQETRP